MTGIIASDESIRDIKFKRLPHRHEHSTNKALHLVFQDDMQIRRDSQSTYIQTGLLCKGRVGYAPFYQHAVQSIAQVKRLV